MRSGKQEKHLVFKSLEDVISFSNGAGNGASNQASNQACSQAYKLGPEDTVDQGSSILEKEIYTKEKCGENKIHDSLLPEAKYNLIGVNRFDGIRFREDQPVLP